MLLPFLAFCQRARSHRASPLTSYVAPGFADCDQQDSRFRGGPPPDGFRGGGAPPPDWGRGSAPPGPGPGSSTHAQPAPHTAAAGGGAAAAGARAPQQGAAPQSLDVKLRLILTERKALQAQLNDAHNRLMRSKKARVRAPKRAENRASLDNPHASRPHSVLAFTPPVSVCFNRRGSELIHPRNAQELVDLQEDLRDTLARRELKAWLPPGGKGGLLSVSDIEAAVEAGCVWEGAARAHTVVTTTQTRLP